MSAFQRFLVQAGVVLVAVNLIGLWVVNYGQSQKLNKLEAASTVLTTPALTPPTISDSPALSELENRIDALEQANQVETVKAPTTAKTSPSVVGSSAAPVSTTLYLGTGSTVSREWTTIPGASLTLKQSQYPGLKRIRFEASLAIVGGEAQARLVETKTGAVFDTTTVIHNTNVSTWQYSSILSLASLDHEFAVQLRSTSGELARLEAARLTLMP
jgi:hypothetical protein